MVEPGRGQEAPGEPWLHVLAGAEPPLPLQSRCPVLSTESPALCPLSLLFCRLSKPRAGLKSQTHSLSCSAGSGKEEREKSWRGQLQGCAGSWTAALGPAGGGKVLGSSWGWCPSALGCCHLPSAGSRTWVQWSWEEAALAGGGGEQMFSTPPWHVGGDTGGLGKGP